MNPTTQISKTNPNQETQIQEYDAVNENRSTPIELKLL